MSPDKRIWFPAKRYGWGWGLPVAWQGWAVLVGYLVLLGGGGWVAGRHPGVAAFFPVYALGLTAGVILVCLKRGEKPRWRWGGKK